MAEVTKQATPFGASWPSAETYRTLADALVEAGAAPELCLFLVADCQLESGRWGSALYNHNVGNVKIPRGATPSAGDWYLQRENNTGQIDAYRAYSTLAEGAAAYLYEIVARRPTAAAAARAQDLDAFAHTLIYGESGQINDGYIGLPVERDDGKTKTYDPVEAVAIVKRAIGELVKEGRPLFDAWYRGRTGAAMGALFAFGGLLVLAGLIGFAA
jgi:hypothetical protein